MVGHMRDFEKQISESDDDTTQLSHELASIIEAIQESEDRWIELSELSQ